MDIHKVTITFPVISSSVTLSVTLGSSLTKNVTFQHTSINFLIVATYFASCVQFLVPHLIMQLLLYPCFCY